VHLPPGHKLVADRAAVSQGERAALRGATGVLRAHARAAAQVQLLLLGWGCDRPRSRRARGARTHRATRATRRRATDPGARLRLGFADAVHGAALSSRIDRRRVELRPAT